jgi:hypothetical protein
MKSFLMPMVFFIAFTGCGGGGGSSTSTESAPAVTSVVPNEAYIGYIVERSLEDEKPIKVSPIVMNVNSPGSTVNGQISFALSKCQQLNAVKLQGSLNGINLEANWSGDIDGTTESGKLTGNYDTVTTSLSGSYTNTLGKQVKKIEPCSSFTQEAAGKWITYPISRNRGPSAYGISATVSIQGNSWQWIPPANTAFQLISFFPRYGDGTSQDVFLLPTFQVLLGAESQKFDLSLPARLSPGLYITAISSWDENGNLLAMGFDPYRQR